MALRILFVPFGSEGDVNPLLWLAEGMAGRGHAVTFLLNPHYGPLADRRGFAWLPVGTSEDFLHIARDPLMFHPQKGPAQVMKLMILSLPVYREAFEKTGKRFDLVVVSSFALGASSLAEAAGIPRLALHFQPVCLRSEYDCPLFLPELAWISRSPRWVKRLFFRLVDATLWSMVSRPLNSFRRELGLPPLKQFYEEAVNGAEGIAGLFPEWFAPPQPDWPARFRQFGFPVTMDEQPLEPALAAFLAAGPPPVVWTHGSANFDIRHFQARALAASRELGLRCLLVSLDPPTEPLPATAFHATHARFEDVFPRCRAAVHHGGIGTTAKAIASGIPQLIIPRSHDQPDNAHRIAQLGLGATMSYPRMDSPALAQTLSALLDSAAIRENCLARRALMLSSDHRPPLCEWAETVARP